MKKNNIIIGTRKSPLALWQSNYVRTTLLFFFPQLQISLKHISTKGDKILDSPLSKIGDKGLFTREIEHALLRGDIDLAVHSLKDLPTQTPEGLEISAVTEREDTRDVLISKSGTKLSSLRRGAIVATGSLRRRSQLLKFNHDLETIDIRGNVNTRLKIYNESQIDAMILAFAGVHRLGLDDHISEILPHEIMLPAVGQGALAIETRVDDEELKSLITPLNHLETQLATSAERSLLRVLEGGCQIPVGAFAQFNGQDLELTAYVGSLDGKQSIRRSLTTKNVSTQNQATLLGAQLALQLLDEGGNKILDQIRHKTKE